MFFEKKNVIGFVGNTNQVLLYVIPQKKRYRSILKAFLKCSLPISVSKIAIKR